jgi:hypothetical protein
MMGHMRTPFFGAKHKDNDHNITNINITRQEGL